MSTRDTLLAEIAEFRKRTGMPETRFGDLAVNDPALILKIKRGRNVTIDMADRLREFMRSYRSKDGKPRPSLEAVA